jgi:hypothetical protein
MALKGKPYCYFHSGPRRSKVSKASGAMGALHLPVMRDRAAIQTGVAQILNALSRSGIDNKHASLLLYGLQIASQNVDRTPARGGEEPGPAL